MSYYYAIIVIDILHIYNIVGSALLCEDALFSKTLIFVIDKLIGNAICFVLREGVKSLLSSTSHEVVQYDSSSPCDGVVAWFKDYNNGDYHLLRVNVTSQSQQHFLSVSPIVGEERWSEYPTALTFILDARGELLVMVLSLLKLSFSDSMSNLINCS